ncbi:PHP domain-containing protein [Tissierella sp. Yu-01]|uniref:PHP domain-containing protein n=1 Tax=Tissierella sp. Yu-01 TaxID=3035694 RepID=UPI00240D7BB3|nr:PHP domain-containing protein [Tissierella sp. Yu-01]WFA10412.1 PHP domain-containing protein [Tissierella sp. Yu-01]
MYKILGDYHTHTIYSSGFRKEGKHATGTIEENANVALKNGLSTIVISEHGPGHYLYGVRKSNIQRMRDEINRLNEIYEPKGLKILLGVESNLVSVDGKLDVEDEFLKYTDILLMGYHYGATPKSFKDAYGLYILNPISKVAESVKDKAIEINTKAYLKALDNYHIDIITHPGSKAKIDIREIAKKASRLGTALEISSKHSELSVESLRKIKDIDVYYYINSDAHKPEDVGNLTKGIQKAKDADVDFNRIKNIREIR